MSEYIKPQQFFARHGVKPHTLRVYASKGMPCRKEKFDHISYPEEECLAWIANFRKEKHANNRPVAPSHCLTIQWLSDTLQTDASTIIKWLDKHNAPGKVITAKNGETRTCIYFEPKPFLEWFRKFASLHAKHSHATGRNLKLSVLEKAIPAFMAAHPAPDADSTLPDFDSDPLIQQAMQDFTETAPQTTKTDMTIPATSATLPATELRPQLKAYDPCRTYQEGDDVQVVLCNGRANGIAANLMYLRGTVLRNENAVGMVLCKLNDNPEQIPASNLRLLRAVEDIPKFAVLHSGHTFYLTPKTEKEAVAYVSYAPESPLTEQDACDIIELALAAVKEKKD